MKKLIVSLFLVSAFGYSQNDDVTFRSFHFTINPIRMIAGEYGSVIEYKFSNDFGANVFLGYQISYPQLRDYFDDAFQGPVFSAGVKKYGGNSAVKFGYISLDLFFKILSYDMQLFTNEYKAIGTQYFYQSGKKVVFGGKFMWGFERMLGHTFFYDAALGIGMRASVGKHISSELFNTSVPPANLAYSSKPISVFYPMVYLEFKIGARFFTKKQMNDFQYSK
jgi:hypothetical protein